MERPIHRAALLICTLAPFFLPSLGPLPFQVHRAACPHPPLPHTHRLIAPITPPQPYAPLLSYTYAPPVCNTPPRVSAGGDRSRLTYLLRTCRICIPCSSIPSCLGCWRAQPLQPSHRWQYPVSLPVHVCPLRYAGLPSFGVGSADGLQSNLTVGVRTVDQQGRWGLPPRTVMCRLKEAW